MLRNSCSVAADLSRFFGYIRPLSIDCLTKADTIVLRELQFHGFHGALPEETVLGQKFRVTAVLYCGAGGLAAAGTSDNLHQSVNYAEVYDDIKQVVEGEPKKLIEAVAEDIATGLLMRYPQLEATRVRVAKPNAPIQGIFESVEVEILRMNTQSTC